MPYANIIPLTDLNRPELALYSRLSENQLLHYFEPDTGIFIAESPIVINRALDAGYEPISILAEESGLLMDRLRSCLSAVAASQSIQLPWKFLHN